MNFSMAKPSSPNAPILWGWKMRRFNHSKKKKNAPIENFSCHFSRVSDENSVSSCLLSFIDLIMLPNLINSQIRYAPWPLPTPTPQALRRVIIFNKKTHVEYSVVVHATDFHFYWLKNLRSVRCCKVSAIFFVIFSRSIRSRLRVRWLIYVGSSTLRRVITAAIWEISLSRTCVSYIKHT